LHENFGGCIHAKRLEREKRVFFDELDWDITVDKSIKVRRKLGELLN
jgi:hypothetical protein